MKKYFILALVPLFFACNSATKTTVNDDEAEVIETADDFDYEKYLEIGNEIANQTQQILLANVSAQMKKSGPVAAVEFCNEKAIVLTDSASEMFMSNISRITDKTRNPNNAFKNAIDVQAWNEIFEMTRDDIKDKHLILRDEGNAYYYKAIPLGMETCLKCHGNVGTDINQQTFDIIKAKYPDDKATGYEMGQLRGLWKIKLNTGL